MLLSFPYSSHISQHDLSFFLFLNYLFILGCAGSLLLHGLFPLVAVSKGYSLVVVCRFLIAVASLVAEHGL